jgi:hypothetical protein
MPRQTYIPSRFLALAVWLVALLHPYCAGAETNVTGRSDAIRLELHDAPIEEVFAALSASFGLRYRSSAALNHRLTGIYEGSLRRVVARVLEGYNFIVKTSAGSVEVVVFDPARREAIPSVPVWGRRVD